MAERKPNPTDAKTYYQMGNDFYEKGDYDKAIENYNMAILLNPIFSEAYFNRALAYYQLKNFDKSIADYTKSMELDPQNPIIYNNRGDSFYRKQDFQSAVKDYDKAIALNPNYLKAFYNRGLSYASIEEYEKAVEDFTKVVKLKPDFAEAYHLRGLAYEYAGTLSSAIADYEKALELNPELAEAKTHLDGAKAKKDQEGKGGGGEGGTADIKMLSKPNMTFNDVAGMAKMKEEIREAVVYPMRNPELARKYGKLGGGGILMYGPPGCGKCMAGETPVLLSSGDIKTISGLYEQFKVLGEKKIGEGEYVLECPGIELPSLNPKTLKIEKKKVEFIYRQKYKGKTCSIQTHSGRNITVTPEHPFISIRDGAVKKKAAQIITGDYIAIPRTIQNESAHPNGIDLSEFRELDGKLQYISQRHPHTRAIIPAYEIDEEIGEYFGYLLSEGASIYGTMYFSNSDQNLISRVAGLTHDVFGIQPRIKPDTSPGVQKVEIGSVTLMRFLEKAHDFKLRGSRNTKVPRAVLTAPLNVAGKFLSAVFECEASIKQDVPQIEFTTASREFANGIAYLLLRFGIVAGIRPKKIKDNPHTYWRIYISSHTNLKAFGSRIGFISSRKLSLLKRWTSRDIAGSTAIDIIPNIPALLQRARSGAGMDKAAFYNSKNGYRYELSKSLSRTYLGRIISDKPPTPEIKQLRTLAESDVLWDRVVSVSEEEVDGYVYDLTIADNHTFIAGFGGVIVHNTFIVKAAAGECQSGFINAKLSDLLDMYVGNTEKNIHKVFELARKNTPCILFFDEVEAIGGRRDQQEGQQYMKMAVNQMLYEMDGVEANNQSVLIIAATNAPWDVDPALRRSGRFSKTIYLPEPDNTSRIAILKMHAKKKPLGSLIPFSMLGIATLGYASADLKSIVDDAATIPWRQAFMAIEKKSAELQKGGMDKEQAEELAKKQVAQRPVTMGDFVTSVSKKRSSLPPWYEQARKQIGKQEEVTIIDGKEHKKVTDSKMGPGEKEAFKDLLDTIGTRNQWWYKLMNGVVKQVTLLLLRIVVLITEGGRLA